MQSLDAETQGALGCTAASFRAVRATSEQLVQGLTPDDCMVQSMPDASPVKWHLAHTSWFFEQFILGPAGVAPFDERYAALFNSYYVGAGTRHPRARRGDLSRPPLDEVLAYRRHVTRAVADLLPRADPHATALARLGIEHEQQHQELILTDLKHHLFSQPLTPAYRPVPAHDGAEPAALQFTAVDGGLCDIGHAGGAFGFDNEFPRHRVWLEPFEITDRLVTEAEYLAFMHDGGYAQATLWLSDGWATREAEGWQAPLYWRADEDGAWQVFTLGGWRAPRADVPVCHVSHYEADAFARWAGARLPTEAEWEHAAATSADGTWHGALLEDEAFHPTPAAHGAGLRQLLGDCWQWTASAYLPYPGYRVPAGTVGEYNGKFMSGQMVLKGASCATPRSHARPSYRNFFPPGARWQFSGIRLARDGVARSALAEQEVLGPASAL